MQRIKVELQEYDSIKNKKVFCNGIEILNAILYKADSDDLVLLGDGASKKCRLKLKEPLFGGVPDENNNDEWRKFARLLGMHLEFEDNKLILKAHWFVGTTRLPVEDGEFIVQVKPKIENLNSSRMLVETLSHPQVAPHIKMGETYEILTDAEPIEIEEVPSDYLLFLMIHYLKILNDLVRRGFRGATSPLRRTSGAG